MEQQGFGRSRVEKGTAARLKGNVAKKALLVAISRASKVERTSRAAQNYPASLRIKGYVNLDEPETVGGAKGHGVTEQG